VKILLVTDYAHPVGGAELKFLRLRDGLRQRGHDARVFSTTAVNEPGASFADYTCHGTTAPYRTLLQSANPFAARQLRRVLSSFQPDVVHVGVFLTQLSPLILPALRTVPSLYHAAWYRPVCPTATKTLPNGATCTDHWGGACYRQGCLPLRDWVPLMIQMNLWHRWRGVFRRIIANSRAIADLLRAHGFGPVEIVWNGLPVVPARPPLADPPTAAFVGRLVPQKGCDVLLRAFALVIRDLPHALLLIVGDGPQRGELEHLAAELRLPARFTGHVATEQMEPLLAGAWVQVVPSRYAEGFGNVAVEAAMRGTAVIASDAGGLRDVIEPNQTGLLVAPGDPAALASALTALLRHRDRAEQLGAAARQRALRHFIADRMVEDFLGHYRAIVSAPAVWQNPTP